MLISSGSVSNTNNNTNNNMGKLNKLDHTP